MNPHPRCDGWGNVPSGDSTAVECPNMRIYRVAKALGPEIAGVKHDSKSPLIGRHEENLFVQAGSWQTFLPHLKAALGFVLLRKAHTHLIVTDERIKSVFVGNEQYRSRPRDERDDEDRVNNGLADLVLGPNLLVIRLGFLGHKNVAASGALKEALMIRQAEDKPSWVVEEDTRFGDCFSYGIDVHGYISNRYDGVVLERYLEEVPDEDTNNNLIEEDRDLLISTPDPKPQVKLAPRVRRAPLSIPDFDNPDLEARAMEESMGLGKKKKKGYRR